MRVSVFTPSHDPRYLNECYQSLLAQEFIQWEWVVVLNKAATQWRPPVEDGRVRTIRAPVTISGVGTLKKFACEQAAGDILVELDHDDTLAPECLSRVVNAFDHNPSASLVFSDFSQMSADRSPNHDRFDAGAGWLYTEEEINGATYLHCHSLAGLPHNVAYIWYAPNHVRAFRRSLYDKAGGYDDSLKVLDDQDLMVKLFQLGDFVHLEQLLYFQRVHAKNTQSIPKTNAFIHTETVAMYDRDIRTLAAAWSERSGVAQLRLRTPTSPPQEPESNERVMTIDPGACTIDAADSTVGVIKMIDLLQRVPDRSALFNECYRALCHGGMVISQTPSTDGRGAFQDPSHVSYWNENSFWYLTQAAMSFSVPDLKARFQVSRLHTGYPTAWHQQNLVPYVYANLIAVKDGPRLGGALLC